MIKPGMNFQFAFLLLVFGILYYTYRLGLRGRVFRLRRLPVFDAIDEAIGRAVEMGRPVMFNFGTYPGREAGAEAVAGYVYLGHIARKCASHGARLIATCFNVPQQVIMRGIVRDAYLVEDKLDSYQEDDVRYLSDQAAAWGASVWGIMNREKIATHFYFDPQSAVSLTVLEYTRGLGVLQFGGATSFYRISDMAVTVDHLIIGEEIYVGTAYLTGELPEMAIIVGVDIIKWTLIVMVIIGAILWTSGFESFVNLIRL